MDFRLVVQKNFLELHLSDSDVKSLSKYSIPSFLIDEDRHFKKTNDPCTFFRIRSSSFFSILKKLYPSSSLVYQGKKLIFDPFSRLFLSLHAQEINDTIQFLGSTIENGTTSSLEKSDTILTGPPHLLIKGSFLKVFHEEIDSEHLKPLFSNFTMTKESFSKFVKDYEKEKPSSLFLTFEMKEEQDPLPVLKLMDPIGLSAKLFMKYEKLVEYREGSSLKESYWEKDLRECGYERKSMSNASYYCPFEKRASSLQLLLELGWHILDWKGRTITPLTNLSLSYESVKNSYHLRGTCSFHTKEINISPLIESLKKKELFLPLSQDNVGFLYHEKLQPLQEMASEIELHQESPSLKKNRIAFMKELFPTFQPESPIPFPSNFAFPSKLQFHGSLRPYQEEASKWLFSLYSQRFSALLADEMGLGKTVEVLHFLKNFPYSILVIVPKALLTNWQREIERFLPGSKVSFFHGKMREFDPSSHFVLTSYTTARIEQESLAQHSFGAIILDEAQTIKNSESQTFQALKSLNAPFKLAITGTPLENSLLDLWSLFSLLDPTLLGEKEAFQAIMSDPNHQKIIRKRLSPFILRRTKKQVALDLPEKIEQTVYVSMYDEQKERYLHFLSSLKAGLITKKGLDRKVNRLQILEAILRLRQMCCHETLFTFQETLSPTAKWDIVIEDLETFMKEDKKVVLYSQFASMLHLFQKECSSRGWKAIKLFGETENRQEVVDQFQEDEETTILLATLKVGGVGLNLTRADAILLYDPWWNHATEEQAIARSHRIGREEPVLAKRYITQETIEERVHNVRSMKKDLFTQFFDESQESSQETLFDIFEEEILR